MQGRLVRILGFAAGLLIGLILMGRAGEVSSRLDEILALAGLGVIIGVWMWATRPTSHPFSGALAMARELRELEDRLQHFETAALLQKKGETLIATNQPKKAIDPLERAVGLEDADIHSHYLLGQAYFAARRYTDAWRCFDRVFRADKDHDYATIRLWAARTYLAMDEPAHAEALADSFLEKEKGHLGGLALKADALYAQSRTADAAAVYRQFLEIYNRTTEFDRKRYYAEQKIARRRASS